MQEILILNINNNFKIKINYIFPLYKLILKIGRRKRIEKKKDSYNLILYLL